MPTISSSLKKKRNSEKRGIESNHIDGAELFVNGLAVTMAMYEQTQCPV